MQDDTAARFAALEVAHATALAGLLRGLVEAKVLDVRVAEDILHATVDKVRAAAPPEPQGGIRSAYLGLAEAIERAAFHMRD